MPEHHTLFINKYKEKMKNDVAWCGQEEHDKRRCPVRKNMFVVIINRGTFFQTQKVLGKDQAHSRKGR